MKRTAWLEQVLKTGFQLQLLLSGVRQQGSPLLMPFTSKSSPLTAISICITATVFLTIPLSLQRDN